MGNHLRCLRKEDPMTLYDRLRKRPTRGQLLDEVKRLAARRDTMDDLASRNADLGRAIEDLRHENAGIKNENVDLRRRNRDLTQYEGSRQIDPERGDPAARRLVSMLLEQDRLPNGPFTDLCSIGPNGCDSHYNERGDCTVAWLKSWVAGHIATPGIAALALVMTGVPDATDILCAALDEYQVAHEAAGAAEGRDGTVWRHRTRHAATMAAAARSNV